MRRKLRTLVYEGKVARFNTAAFKDIFTERRIGQSLSITEYTDYLSDKLFVSQDTIKSWRSGINGPADIEKVNELASVLNVNIEKLLVEEKTMEIEKNTIIDTKMTDREKESLSKVYQVFYDFMTSYKNSDGFMCISDSEKYPIDEAYRKYEMLEETLKREYVFLKRTIYDALMEFVAEIMIDIFAGVDFEFEQRVYWNELTPEEKVEYEKAKSENYDIYTDYLVENGLGDPENEYGCNWVYNMEFRKLYEIINPFVEN